ncbi:16S rRNA (cytosine(967)-C(5))-methyltransferase RsmB [Massilioclostridium coli]|uniref:16S rRNA (cytosine(967)-C(5))-methyltransferase RsmB n=1 Tax=Massilioclostridium coli TaxID=1870991 RepID=UPI00085C694A|nr:16S rRNA (cytosine(967)-C(5))-methyltransferase RsmB [Massilioclostridium coli]
MKTARQIALESLNRMEKQQAYSNLMMESLLKHSDLDSRDRDFASKLFYGVLESKITLDYIITCYSKHPIEKMTIEIRNILRLGLYQMISLQVDDFAAVNESVNLTKAIHKKAASGFVNAVLRNFLRDGKKINYPDSERKPVQYFSLRYSCPVWLVESLFNEYGREVAEQLLQQQMGRPPLTLRVNPLKTTKEELSIQLEEQGFTLKPHLMENCVEVLDGGSLADTALFEQGMFHVQDVASQLCGQVVAAYHPDSVLDVCAAPGGKTFTIAEELKDTVPITACDLHEHRVKLIKSGAKRLGLSSVHAQVSDASIYHEKIGKFGLVLCDVPCSGFGVIRRKPEIKYKSEQSVEGLPKIQMNILEIASQYVKAGGVLIYSTCTLSKRENQEITKAFLLQHPEFSPLQLPEVLTQFYPHAGYDLTFLPNQLDSDGFYLCAMKKRGITV